MQSPLSVPGRSGPGASSNVKLPTAGGDVRRNWTAINQVASGLAGQAAGLQGLRDQVNAQKFIARRLDTLFPFKLYQLPDVLRTTPDPVTDWLKWRVRWGLVCLDSAQGFVPDGTDGVDAPFDEGYTEKADGTAIIGATEYTLTSSVSPTWFWIDLTIPCSGACSGVIHCGVDPTADGWTDFPNFDGLHIALGYVDTYTQAAAYCALPTQYQIGHFVFHGIEMCLDLEGGGSHTYLVPAFQRADNASKK